MAYRLLLVLWVFGSILSPTALKSQELQIDNPIRFLALGDSYTIGQSVPVAQRWPEQLMDSLENRGFDIDTLRIIATTGWRTDNLLNAIRSQDLQNENYNLVSLLIGVNNQFQSRPFSQYMQEFPILLDSAISYAGGDPSHVFVVSIPDYAYTPFGQQSGNASEISEKLDEYNEYNRQIAGERGVTYFDITPISRLGIQHPEYVAGDGLHPSGNQYTEWVKLMLELIDQQSTGLTGENRKLEISVFPNPALNEVLVEMHGEETDEAYTIQLYTITGSLIHENQTLGKLQSISLKNYPDGVYFIKITSGSAQVVKKLIKG
ncbi:MAG: T9SS type A sorting domain-containing protein [Saprospiraceae bacterium]|nr:T9SS type A sorting domain-containing protein [Saprospiraceae bacterium]